MVPSDNKAQTYMYIVLSVYIHRNNVNAVYYHNLFNFCNIRENYELRLHGKPFRIILSRSIAFLGTLWVLSVKSAPRKVVTQSSFGVK